MSEESARLFIEEARIGLSRAGTARRLGWSALLAWVFLFPLGMELRGALAHSASGASLLRVVVGWGLLLSPFAFLAAALALFSGVRRRRGSITLTEQSLLIARGDRTVRIPLHRITAGTLLPAVDAARVELELTSGDRVSAWIRDAELARALVSLAGLDPGKRRLTVRIRRVLYNTMFAAVAPLVLLVGAGVMSWIFASTLGSLGVIARLLLVFALPATLLVVAWRNLLGTDVTVGSDGLLLRRRFREVFVPFRTLRTVDLRNGYLELEQIDGAVERYWADGDLPPGPEVLLARIREAMAARGAGAENARSAALGRHGRSLSQWKNALIAALSDGATYRHAPIEREELERILHDGAAATEHRIAAAMALLGAGVAGAREQVRAAASASASAPVRVALERVVRDELDESTLAKACDEPLLRAEYRENGIVR